MRTNQTLQQNLIGFFMTELTIENKLDLLDKAEKIHCKQFAKKLWDILGLPNFESTVDCNQKIFDFLQVQGQENHDEQLPFMHSQSRVDG